MVDEHSKGEQYVLRNVTTAATLQVKMLCQQNDSKMKGSAEEGGKWARMNVANHREALVGESEGFKHCIS